ncbi:MAG: hypothetical protein NVS1B7_0920 [Candidatus Saccharimonadales bacterium]
MTPPDKNLLLIGLATMLLVFCLGILLIVSSWKVFEKAHKPGWASIVPFYNAWILAEVGGKPGWLGILANTGLLLNYLNPFSSGGVSWGYFIVITVLSLISAAVNIIIGLGVAERFNKTRSFGLLLGLVPFIGYPMLAFGDAKYSSTDNSVINDATNMNPSAIQINAPPIGPHSSIIASQFASPALPQPAATPAAPSISGVNPVSKTNRSGWAIAAYYVGLTAILVLPAPIALMLGIIAINDIKKHPTKRGKGGAWFAIIAGTLGTSALLYTVAQSL